MERIPLFPLHTVLFPQMDLPLSVFEERYRVLVTQCLESGDGFGVVMIRRGRAEYGPAEPRDVGTYASIAQHARLPDGRYLLEVEGARRFRINRMLPDDPYPVAEVEFLPESVGDFGIARQASEDVGCLIGEYLSRRGQHDGMVQLPVDPISRSWLVAGALAVDMPERQSLLEMDSAADRLDRESSILRRELMLLEHNIR